MGGQHGKHTEHVKFLITLMAKLFSKQPFLNHARLPRVLKVPENASKCIFWDFLITFKLIHPIQHPTQKLGINIHCASEVLHLLSAHLGPKNF